MVSPCLAILSGIVTLHRCFEILACGMLHAACCLPNERIELDVRRSYPDSLEQGNFTGFARSHDRWLKSSLRIEAGSYLIL